MNGGLGLVLGGGAALGFAHLGVLKYLEEIDVRPSIITGTSMGALIGGLYASGKSVNEIISLLDDFSVFKVLDIKFVPFLTESILNSKKINKYLKNLFGDRLIEELKIKYGCVSVNLNKGEVFEFTKGELWEAVRCSISVPTIFEPYKYNGEKHIDGGVMDNLPTSLASKLGASNVIDVNVVDYDNALIEKKSLITSLINCITLAQKELVKIKSKQDLLIQMKLKEVSMGNFCSENALKAYVEGYEMVKSNYAQFINDLIKT